MVLINIKNNIKKYYAARQLLKFIKVYQVNRKIHIGKSLMDMTIERFYELPNGHQFKLETDDLVISRLAFIYLGKKNYPEFNVLFNLPGIYDKSTDLNHYIKNLTTVKATIMQYTVM